MNKFLTKSFSVKATKKLLIKLIAYRSPEKSEDEIILSEILKS